MIAANIDAIRPYSVAGSASQSGEDQAARDSQSFKSLAPVERRGKYPQNASHPWRTIRMLPSNSLVGFIPSSNSEDVRKFYEQTLDLKAIDENDHVVVLRS